MVLYWLLAHSPIPFLFFRLLVKLSFSSNVLSVAQGKEKKEIFCSFFVARACDFN